MATFEGWKCKYCGKTKTGKDGKRPENGPFDKCPKSPDKEHRYERNN